MAQLPSYAEVNKNEIDADGGIARTARSAGDEEETEETGSNGELSVDRTRCRTFGLAALACSFLVGFIFGIIAITVSPKFLTGVGRSTPDRDAAGDPFALDDPTGKGTDGEAVGDETAQVEDILMEQEEQEGAFTVLEQVQHDKTSFT